MAIEQLVNKALKKVYFKSRCSGNGSRSGGRSSVKSNVTCHKCGNKGHVQKNCRSKGTGYIRNPPKKYTNEIPEWVAKKPVVSDTKYLATSTMNRNNKKYKWYTSCNNGNVSWGFHWKDGHDEWENKRGKKSSICFNNSATNAIIYCSYLITTSEEESTA